MGILRPALFVLILPMGVPAQAAPTCQDRDGGTIRCGAAGARPRR